MEILLFAAEILLVKNYWIQEKEPNIWRHPTYRSNDRSVKRNIYIWNYNL